MYAVMKPTINLRIISQGPQGKYLRRGALRRYLHYYCTGTAINKCLIRLADRTKAISDGSIMTVFL